MSVTNSLSNLKLFVCPSDKSRASVTNLAELRAKGTSYQVGTFPNEKLPLEQAQNYMLIRCSIHDNAALADGSVHMVTPAGMSNFYLLGASPK